MTYGATTKLSFTRANVEALAAQQPGFVGIDLQRVSTVLFAKWASQEATTPLLIIAYEILW